MEQTTGGSLLDRFSALEDPRPRAKVPYPLPEIMLPPLGATLAAADDFVEVQLRGNRQLAFLRRLRPYLHGLPSHDTPGAVIRALDDPGLFKACFAAGVAGPRGTEPDIIAVDGKAARRTHARRRGREPLHLAAAWASRRRLVLGQEAVAGKSNEIAAIPRLLERLARAGALVAVDPIGNPGRNRWGRPAARRRRSPGARGRPAGHLRGR